MNCLKFFRTGESPLLICLFVRSCSYISVDARVFLLHSGFVLSLMVGALSGGSGVSDAFLSSRARVRPLKTARGARPTRPPLPGRRWATRLPSKEVLPPPSSVLIAPSAGRGVRPAFPALNALPL